MSQVRILAAVVTFNPDLEQLRKLNEALQNQVEVILWLDNASSNQAEVNQLIQGFNQPAILNCENLGLAAAYNQAASYAVAHEYTHIILFDQDSIPSVNMIGELLHGLNLLSSEPVACVGPNYYDVKAQGSLPFVTLKGLSFKRQKMDNQTFVETDHLISSGCLIPLNVLNTVGGFKEELFIDFIDIEWCLRARLHGLKSFGIVNAQMAHNIGENSLKIFNKNVCIHSPFRLYYQFRNQLWMIKQTQFSKQFRLALTIRMCKLLILFTVFVPDRMTNLKFIAKGLRDACNHRMGRYKH